MAATVTHQPVDVDIEAIVKKVVSEMISSTNTKDSTLVAENLNRSLSKPKKNKRKDGSKKKKKRPSKRTSKKDRESRLQRTSELVNTIGNLMNDLENLRDECFEEKPKFQIPDHISCARSLSDTTIGDDLSDEFCDFSIDSFDELFAGDCETDAVSDSLTRSSRGSGSTCLTVSDNLTRSSRGSGSTCPTVGSKDFYKAVAARLKPQNGSICIQGDFVPTDEEISRDPSLSEDVIEAPVIAASLRDFDAAFGPNDMRCLALVSHNEMKATMRDFVVHHKHILKKFRLTGTQSTMKMLAEVFADEPDIVFGPSCQSGPLGGDAELVALMTRGELGGVLFFQDPMTSHPHQADIQCLVRQAMVHNILIANTPTTAMSIMEVFRSALTGAGRPESIPSFFFSLQSPTVSSYKNSQSQVIKRCSATKVNFSQKNTVHAYKN